MTATPSYYIVTTPVEGKDGITRFPRVGVAFPNGKADAKSAMNIELDAFPVNGKLVLFAPDPKSDESDQK